MSENDAGRPEQWIVVRNWERFQHYKDRRPPWVKLYLDLQHDDNWIGLTPHRRAMLVGIWLEYAGSSRALRAHTRRLSRALHMQVTRSDLEALNHAGFIHFSASKPLAPRARSQETETYKEEELALRQSQKPANASLNVGSAKLDFAALLKQAGRQQKNG